MRSLFLLMLLFAGPAWSKGTLVIVGGGLSPDNAEVYRAFIDGAQGGTIAIIPAASGEPSASLQSFADNLVRHGVKRDRIALIHLAEVDDPETPAVDEASWARNANSGVEIAKIMTASAIWFTGGDQARTTRLLVRDGEDTPMLAALYKRLKSGAVIGGTSAGAAIMGTGMIVCGDPRRAGDHLGTIVDCAPQEGQTEPLVLGRGLGFLPGYVVDQHFTERSRTPRLIRAVACGAGRGIGIDENTALLVDLRSKLASVIGAGTVTTVEKPFSGKRCDDGNVQAHVVVQRAGQQVRLKE